MDNTYTLLYSYVTSTFFVSWLCGNLFVNYIRNRLSTIKSKFTWLPTSYNYAKYRNNWPNNKKNYI